MCDLPTFVSVSRRDDGERQGAGLSYAAAGRWQVLTAVGSVVVVQPPTGTVTFLFTDIEGSTRRWQDEPDAMRTLLTEHDAILRDVVEKHRGHLFKHTGDGVAAAFGRRPTR